MRLFFVVARPLIWLLQASTNVLLRGLRLEPPGAQHEAHSEAELRMLLSSSAEQGEIEHEEQEMLSKVFDFADKEVSDVMVPRPEVVAISIALPAVEALKAVLESPYTRYPGVPRVARRHRRRAAHPRPDPAMYDEGIATVDLESLVRAAYMVPETKDLGSLLTEFRRTNQHMAVVIDEYGSMEGIVTLEDLLEEIVGEIEDEFDQPDETLEQVDDDTIRIDGTFPIEEFNEPLQVRPAERGLPHARRLRLRRARPWRGARRRGRPRRRQLHRRLRRGPAHRPVDGQVPAVGPRASNPCSTTTSTLNRLASVSEPLEELRAVVRDTPAAPPAMHAYLEKVRTRAYTVVDADIDGLRAAGITEDEIFEQTVAAAIGEGLRRLDAADRVIA